MNMDLTSNNDSRKPRRERKISIVELIEGPSKARKRLLRALRKNSKSSNKVETFDKDDEGVKETSQNNGEYAKIDDGKSLKIHAQITESEMSTVDIPARDASFRLATEKNTVSHDVPYRTEDEVSTDMSLKNEDIATEHKSGKTLSSASGKSQGFDSKISYIDNGKTSTATIEHHVGGPKMMSHTPGRKKDPNDIHRTASDASRDKRRRRWSYSLRQLLQKDGELVLTLKTRFHDRKISRPEPKPGYLEVNIENANTLEEIENEFEKLQTNFIKLSCELSDIKSRLKHVSVSANAVFTPNKDTCGRDRLQTM